MFDIALEKYGGQQMSKCSVDVLVMHLLMQC